MDAEQAALALANASGALVTEHDTAGFLANLLESCQDVLSADASGILTSPDQGRLELLAASTHASAELELHQAQVDEGPCVDARDHNESVAVTGDQALAERWPTFGPAMIRAGYHAVHSAPLRWQQHTIGAMALFRQSPVPFTDQEDAVAQAFADIASLLIVHSEPVDLQRLNSRIEDALASRVAVEQAKGVLAQQREIPMDEAYQLLLQLSVSSGASLSDTARGVIRGASR